MSPGPFSSSTLANGEEGGAAQGTPSGIAGCCGRVSEEASEPCYERRALLLFCSASWPRLTDRYK